LSGNLTEYAGRLKELAGLIHTFTGEDGLHETAIPAVRLIRTSGASIPLHTVYEPAICLVAQGSKEVTLAGKSSRYSPGDYFVISVDLPVASQVLTASPEAPYLCLQLQFDANMIIGLMKEETRPPEKSGYAERGLFIERASPPLLNAAVRLMQLLETPEDIPVLAPLVIREIYYRILQGKQGYAFRQMAIGGSSTRRIADVIQRIREDFSKTLSIEELAKTAHMGTTSLHRYFKEVTAMSPLQYQKRLRLHEARRLLISEAADAADIAYRVGYESPSQFSREYARLFGLPPKSDLKRLKSSLQADAL
jgi:AraC-like DNA-binding protein